jgi:hypothetical protein
MFRLVALMQAPQVFLLQWQPMLRYGPSTNMVQRIL